MLRRRMSTNWICLSLGCALMGVVHVTPSRAAEPPAVAGAPEPAGPVERGVTAVEDDPLASALLEADRRFVAGDLQGALDVLEPACDASARPECAFSLAAIHHGLGHCREARASYRRYRELAPAGEHVEEAAAALEEVETRCGDRADPAPSAAAPAPSTSATPFGAPTPPAFAAGVGEPGPPPQAPLAPPPDALGDALVTGSLALSGAAAVTSIVFGVLAARSASRCARAEVYDRRYSDECEQRGPRYQGLWQGFALASGGFLGIGLSLWWLDTGSPTPNGVSAGGAPALRYYGRF